MRWLVVYYLTVVAVVYLLSADPVATRMRLWQATTKVCWRTAHAFGRMAMFAELHYNNNRSVTL